jgi:hypothetical protein
MDALVLAAKSAIAVMLLVAGGAKLADLSGFAATLRLFIPRPLEVSSIRTWAGVIVLAELALGTASLSAPGASWLNPVVFALCCAFAIVSATGYALFRGRSCQCFGALSRRRFDLSGLARSAVVAGLAALAMSGVEPAKLRLGAPATGLLLCGAALVALAAFTAARALDASYDNLSRR